MTWIWVDMPTWIMQPHKMTSLQALYQIQSSRCTYPEMSRSLLLPRRRGSQIPQRDIIHDVFAPLDIVFQTIKPPSQRIIPEVELPLRVSCRGREVERNGRTREKPAKRSFSNVAMRRGREKLRSVTAFIASRAWFPPCRKGLRNGSGRAGCGLTSSLEAPMTPWR